MNLIAVSVLSAWLFNQTLKAIISKNSKKFLECGGMPSSHSAFVSALCTATGLTEGFNSTIFFVALVFAIIVAHDAMKVRKQHTPQEVIAGILMGITITLLVQRALF